MKKFLLLVLMCAGIMGSTYSMEQPLDLSYVLNECQDEIVSKLDGGSFSSLTQVCTLFQRICDAVPLKYLAIDFCDAAEHGNKHLIDRFIVQPNEWMFEQGMGEEVFVQQDADIKVLKRSFNGGPQRFLGDCSFCCVKQADKIVRCFWFWKSPEMFENKPQAAHCTVFNIEKCDDAINTASKECLELLYGSLDTPFFKIYFLKEVGRGKYFINISMSVIKHWESGSFTLLDLYPAEIFIRKIGMFMLLVLAAQKNNTMVVNSILDGSTVPYDWIKDIGSDRYDLLLYNFPAPSVHDVLTKALKLRSEQK